MLNPVEYDMCIKKIEAHICSLEEQLRRVIKQGPTAIINGNKQVSQGKNESLKDFHARFTNCVGQWNSWGNQYISGKCHTTFCKP